MSDAYLLKIILAILSVLAFCWLLFLWWQDYRKRSAITDDSTEQDGLAHLQESKETIIDDKISK